MWVQDNNNTVSSIRDSWEIVNDLTEQKFLLSHLLAPGIISDWIMKKYHLSQNHLMTDTLGLVWRVSFSNRLSQYLLLIFYFIIKLES